MKATAQQHLRVRDHLMEFCGFGEHQAEFVAVEAWAAVAPVVEDACERQRDELLAALRVSHGMIHSVGFNGDCSTCSLIARIDTETKGTR